MQFSFGQVKSLLDEVEPFLKKAGVSERRRTMPTGEIDLIKAEKFIEVFDYLHDLLHSEEWAEVQKVWSLLTPETWAGYEMFEFEDLAEQILLTKALEKLKRRWKPPSFFGKHYEYPDSDGDSEDAEGLGVQPETTGSAEADC